MQEDSKIHERRNDHAWRSSYHELGDHTDGRGPLQRRGGALWHDEGRLRLGVIGLMEDLGGLRMQIELETDSSAAKGITSQKGVGKVKHLERTLRADKDQED